MVPTMIKLKNKEFTQKEIANNFNIDVLVVWKHLQKLKGA